MRDFCDYPYIFMRDFLLFVFQFTCCSDLVGFKFQVNRKTQNHISVYLQVYVPLSLFVFYYLSSSTDVALDISVVILFTVSYISLLSLSSRQVFFFGWICSTFLS